MRPNVEPTACLPFEPDEVRRLSWLPLAVRHKLDGCGLRLTLTAWQALPLAVRAALLHQSSGPAFALLAGQAGATTDMRINKQIRLQIEEIAQALNCDRAAADAWLVSATPFAHYALDKRRKIEAA